MDLTKAAWEEQRKRWQRFRAWEDDRLGSEPRDLAAALNWMDQAWKLARRLNPWWTSTESAEEHWQYLAEIQRRLLRARPEP